MFDKKRVSKKS